MDVTYVHYHSSPKYDSLFVSLIIAKHYRPYIFLEKCLRKQNFDDMERVTISTTSTVWNTQGWGWNIQIHGIMCNAMNEDCDNGCIRADTDRERWHHQLLVLWMKMKNKRVLFVVSKFCLWSSSYSVIRPEKPTNSINDITTSFI